MSAISVRGLDQKALARLKQKAQREGTSFNAVAVRALEAEAGTQPAGKAQRVFDDLDALAGTWKAADARAFEGATAAFGEVDEKLWK
jgi:hypothetical protein